MLKDYLIKIESKKGYFNRLKTFSYALFFISLLITIFQFGRIGRDRALIEDVQKIGKFIGGESELYIADDIVTDWALKGYFARYLSVGLTVDKDIEAKYLISKKKIDEQKVGDSLKLEVLHLYLAP